MKTSTPRTFSIRCAITGIAIESCSSVHSSFSFSETDEVQFFIPNAVYFRNKYREWDFDYIRSVIKSCESDSIVHGNSAYDLSLLFCGFLYQLHARYGNPIKQHQPSHEFLYDLEHMIANEIRIRKGVIKFCRFVCDFFEFVKLDSTILYSGIEVPSINNLSQSLSNNADEACSSWEDVALIPAMQLLNELNTYEMFIRKRMEKREELLKNDSSSSQAVKTYREKKDIDELVEGLDGLEF